MTKQEEIREGLRWELAQVTENSENVTIAALRYLHSQGVVIKVEEWLPTRKGMVCTVNPLIEEING